MVEPHLLEEVEAVLQGTTRALTTAEVYAHCDHVDGRATAAIILNELCRSGRAIREQGKDGLNRFQPRKRRKTAAAAPRSEPAAPLRKPKRQYRRRDPLADPQPQPSTKPTLAERIRLALATAGQPLSVAELAERLRAPEENIENILVHFEVPAGRVSMWRSKPGGRRTFKLEARDKGRAA